MNPGVLDAMPWIEPLTFTGNTVSLVPLERDHTPALAEAVRDGELWRLWYTSVPSPETMPAEVARRLSLHTSGSMLPFTVIDQTTGEPAGMTTYMNIDHVHRRVEIGSTWYRKSVQRGPVNTEAKLMLLTHAFEKLACIAVAFRTHTLNHQSRRAIERLGAKLDGILRSHQRLPNGTLRDTCVYSITEPEWPAVQANLEWQLVKPR